MTYFYVSALRFFVPNDLNSGASVILLSRRFFALTYIFLKNILYVSR